MRRMIVRLLPIRFVQIHGHKFGRMVGHRSPNQNLNRLEDVDTQLTDLTVTNAEGR